MKYYIIIHHYFNFNRMKLEDFYTNFVHTVVYDFSFKTKKLPKEKNKNIIKLFTVKLIFLNIYSNFLLLNIFKTFGYLWEDFKFNDDCN